LAGEGRPFEFEGKSYLLSPRLDFRGEAAFAAWAATEAAHAVERTYKELGPELLNVYRAGHRHDLGARHYDFTGGITGQAVFSDAGVVRLAVLLSQMVKGNLTPEVADRVRADREAWKRLKEQVWDASVPNWREPAPEAGPAPGSAPSGSSQPDSPASPGATPGTKS
jgi:hypothetical protein